MMVTATKRAETVEEHSNIYVPIEQVTVRPELFQARDTDTNGGSVGEIRVREIVDNWNEERFDPLSVVWDPQSVSYVTIGGHHRRVAAERIGKERIPVRVLQGDPNDPQDRERLIREAIISNYTLSTPNIRENANAAHRLAETGLSVEEVAKEMRIKKSKAKDLIAIQRTGPVVLESLTLHEELIPVAAEIGHAMGDYGVTEEAAGALFKRDLYT